MNFLMNRKSLISISLALLLSLSPFAFAHFHYELPITTHFQVNENNQLASLKISWTYDDEVSGLMLTDQKDVEKLTKKLKTDLSQLAYFTAIKLNGKVVETGEATSFTLEKIKHDDYSNLKLTFTLPLKTAVSLQGDNTLDINHEDAMASAIIYYADVNSFTFDSKLKSQCKGNIVEKKDFEEGESPQATKVICN